MAGYSGTPLPQKLGIKPRCRLGLAKAPEKFAASLTPLPDAVTITDAARGKGPFDVVVAFVTSPADLDGAFARLAPKLAQAGGLWIAWPKKSSGMATLLDEDVVRRTGLATERLVDNKVCAIDLNGNPERVPKPSRDGRRSAKPSVLHASTTWSALRFVVRLSHR